MCRPRGALIVLGHFVPIRRTRPIWALVTAKMPPISSVRLRLSRLLYFHNSVAAALEFLPTFLRKSDRCRAGYMASSARSPYDRREDRALERPVALEELKEWSSCVGSVQ